jgi:hypothetical protein
VFSSRHLKCYLVACAVEFWPLEEKLDYSVSDKKLLSFVVVDVTYYRSTILQ